MIEIERKFLVNNNTFKEQAFKSVKIVQGFLSTNPERTVRIRLKDDVGTMTVKGKSSGDGLSRFEWEKEISKPDALDLLELCEDVKIDKTRYLVKVENHTFEIDVFNLDNEGLIIAEVELNSENEDFPRPEWLGKEVTGDIKYYNSQLSKQPFNIWNN
ncbi:CYTH domain-containing protein [Ichthyenterobacterium sp. W332]|uniref:CYTH domain-containing protein n=1 Tax=Microcosmobacter mediterraneus TaxID=3075607 RepID=A0ABU2YIH7_9FLAO|nr:CYTH domain-containing protein [Ichthyenterobacterium sp. W332]MDT0557956.1 CYTH domain-containing protein [Ichthyenterobacterium sp. W332]